VKLEVIRRPITVPGRLNWAVYQACGAIVPPPSPSPRQRGGWGERLRYADSALAPNAALATCAAPCRAWTARLFVIGLVALITVPMLMAVTR
jgi:hypothetical protein